MSDRYDAEYGGHEPIMGLPQRLPKDEHILWQGGPRFRSLARHALHLRGLAIYFVVLLAWFAVWSVSSGYSHWDAAVATARLAGLSLAALGLLALYAWMATRSTVYTITNKRVVMRFGIALPMTVNLPFSKLNAASLHAYADGSGDIALQPTRAGKLTYVVLWPHARPWRLARAEPALRCVPDAASVTQILGRAFAASAGMAVQPAPELQQAAHTGLVGTASRATA